MRWDPAGLPETDFRKGHLSLKWETSQIPTYMPNKVSLEKLRDVALRPLRLELTARLPSSVPSPT